MFHHRQRLTLGLETGDDILGVHAELDDFHCDAAANRFFLFGHVNHAAAAFAKPLKQFVAGDARVPALFVGKFRARFFVRLQAGWLRGWSSCSWPALAMHPVKRVRSGHRRRAGV